MAKNETNPILNEFKETDVYRKFKGYQDWLNHNGIPERTKTNIEMCEGKQWAEATDRTERMPRPVFNVYSYLLDTKLGNILGSPMHINYISDETREVSNRFTKISEYVRKEAREEHYDYIVSRMSLLTGTSFKYYYFDEEAIGKKGEYKGAVRIEMLDLMDVAFADPTEEDIQKQKWIIIRNRVELETAKKICESKQNAELITADEIDNTVYTDLKELEGTKMVYVYTMMARIDGEVHFKKATKTVLLHDYKPANPKLVEKKYKKKIEKMLKDEISEEDLKIDTKIEVDHDSDLEKVETKKSGYKAYLYPVNDLTFKKKHKSIIGIPEFNDAIEVQRTINSNHGVATLNNLQMACPKYVVKENALDGQVITNKVGETIVDHTPAGQRGIDILQGQPITTGALSLAPNSLEMLKVIKGANDIITGETSSKDLSGYAIAQLSAQSQKPIALLQKELWRHKEREAEIFRQFIILFYNEKTEYKYRKSQGEIEQEIAKNQILSQKGIEQNPIQEYTKDSFIGEEFEDFEFDVSIEVGAGTQYSEIQSMSQLDNLLGSQYIDFQTYIECYPNKAMPFKQNLKDAIRAREMSENTQLKQQVQQLTQQLEQLAQYSKSLEGQNSDYKRSVAESQNLVKQLQKEYSDKINYANKLLMEKDNQNVN